MQPNELFRMAGQSLWLDDMKRSLLKSGVLRHYVEKNGVTGITSNPTIFAKSIEGSADYDADIARGAAGGREPEDIFYDMALSDLLAAAKLLEPIHQRTGGVDGWVSLEISPHLSADVKGSVRIAKALHARARCPNLLMKIPGTREGLLAVEETVFSGVPVNITLLFSAKQYKAAVEAYMRALERRIAAGMDPLVDSVASLFISRWDVAVKDSVGPELRNRLGLAIGQEAYAAYREVLDSARWQRLMNEGAKPQRLLFASTSTKDPAAPELLYVEGLAAPLTINTMPEPTLLATIEHGKPGAPLPADGSAAAKVLELFTAAGIDLGALAERLQVEGAASFSKSWDELMARIVKPQGPTTRRGMQPVVHP